MPTSFATDIRLLFRPTDIGCMAPRGVLLGSADWMCDPAASAGFSDHGNARRVFAALSQGVMPPNGKWPQERLDRYQKWMDEGFNP
ncbi:MAG TPA: hypothetical protein VIE66_16615 [Methylocella sp.]|jgi:hypothetical protein